jgi:hypothetical protein
MNANGECSHCDHFALFHGLTLIALCARSLSGQGSTTWVANLLLKGEAS